MMLVVTLFGSMFACGESGSEHGGTAHEADPAPAAEQPPAQPPAPEPPAELAAAWTEVQPDGAGGFVKVIPCPPDVVRTIHYASAEKSMTLQLGLQETTAMVEGVNADDEGYKIRIRGSDSEGNPGEPQKMAVKWIDRDKGIAAIKGPEIDGTYVDDQKLAAIPEKQETCE